MRKITLSFSKNRLCLISFILLFSLFMSQNTFSKKIWTNDYMKFWYDPFEKSITCKFVYFDYKYRPAQGHGYLKWCDFFFMENKTLYRLMRVETTDKKHDHRSFVSLKHKKRGTSIQLLECLDPLDGTYWLDHNKSLKIETDNDHDRAYLKFKWFLGDTFKNVKSITINGFWKVEGGSNDEEIKNVEYDIRSNVISKSINLKGVLSTIKSEVNITKNNSVKVAKETDAIIVKGAEHCESIKIYTDSGAEVKSMIPKSEVVNIKLPKNQI